jgi:hypothetical protein
MWGNNEVFAFVMSVEDKDILQSGGALMWWSCPPRSFLCQRRLLRRRDVQVETWRLWDKNCALESKNHIGKDLATRKTWYITTENLKVVGVLSN